MKIKILILTLLLFYIIPINNIFADTNVEKNPILIIENPSYNHPEVVRPGKSVSNIFIVKNNGNADLIIERIVSSCNCTVSTYDKIIAPGQTGQIHMLVKTDNDWAGNDFKRSSIVISNDPKNAKAVITIGGEVDSYQTQNFK